jgi:hypothetical protein
MLNALFRISLITSVFALPTPVQAQVDVDTREELIAAINNTSIPWVRIPTGVEITIINELTIHSGHLDNFRFTIDGILRWVDTPPALQGDQETMININGASSCTVDGAGTLTSSFFPCGGSTACGGLFHPHIVKGIRIASASGITVENLRFANISSMVVAEGNSVSTGITLRNLLGEELAEYGLFLANQLGHKIQTMTIDNCHVEHTYNFHGFRVYSDSLVMRDCSAVDAARRGFWVVRGNGVLVERFQSNKWCWVGPDTENPSTQSTERVLNSEFHHLDVPEFRLDGGVECCFFTDVCTTVTPGVRIGRDNYTVVLPISNVHWFGIIGTPTLGTHPSIDDETIFAVAACQANVERAGASENHVDIDDLLAVISAWGPCPGAPVVCSADIAPSLPCGNNAVDIDDLLLVISSWGPCPATPACAGGSEGGPAESPPETIDDCWDKCSDAYPGGGQAWVDCFEACLQALEQLGSGGG